MATGTALVNARTPNAVPNDQFQGRYVYTPPEVVAYQRGEELTEAEMSLVRNYFGGALPLRGHTVSPQSPEDYPAATAKAALAGQQLKPTRLRSKNSKVQAAPPELEEIAVMLSDALNNDSAWVLLTHLAERFELELE